MENAVLVSYSVSKWSNTKTDRKISKEVAEKHGLKGKAGRYQKILMIDSDYDNMAKAAQMGRDAVYAYCLPWQKNQWLCNPRGFDALNDILERAKERFDYYADRVADSWDAKVEKESIRLGPLFRRSDYPSASQFREKCGITSEVTPLIKDRHFDDVAEIIGPEVAQELADTLAKKQTEQWQHATRSVWQRLFDTLTHVHERMSNGQRFSDSILGDLTELTDLLPVLNISNDPDLDARRKELTSLLAMYSTESIKNETTRSQCASDVNAILAKINL